MENKKPKNILFVCGILHGHFTGDVEIARELVSLGHNVTYYVLDNFAKRMEDIGGNLVKYKADSSDYQKYIPRSPPQTANIILFAKAYDAILTLLSKDDNKYDYYIFDSFFDVQEMNKILKIPPSKIVLIYTCFLFTDENVLDMTFYRKMGLKFVDEKYNLNLHDFVEINYIPNQFKKFILTSKLFHLRSENADENCYFIGPSYEKRKKDENFNFKKDKNKKLIYISLGTIFNTEGGFFQTCIETFKDSEEYQVIISVGKFIDMKQFKNIPKNIYIFDYIPQTQLLPEVDIFITHGGLNSVQEGILNGKPLIIIPQKYDQFDNSRRIELFEAGIILDKNKIEITAEALKNAVKNINVDFYRSFVKK